MAIPDDDTIQRELLALLASLPQKRILASEAYTRLAALHPELTVEERTQRYRNSLNKWANRVQFARLHLVNRGLIYKAGRGLNPQAGYWVLTPKGEEEVSVLGRSPGQRGTADALETQVASDLEALQSEEAIEEGGKTAKLVARYERNPSLRAAAIRIHGTNCNACGFNYQHAYGEHGKDYIEVHHVVPISTYIEPRDVNPASDLIVLCSNCHRMIHRRKERPLTLDQLRDLVRNHADRTNP